MNKIGILCSGDLGMHTLKQVVHARPVEFVMTDRGSSPIIEFCKTTGIPVFCGNPRQGAARAFVARYPIDVLASINYLFLIEPDLIDHAKRLTFNVHGSLLPKYRGRTPHVWAIINGEKQVGITAHEIVEQCDAGNIIEQIVIPVGEHDTGGSILAKYREAYGPLVLGLLNRAEQGPLPSQPQDESQATWFGKRTPDDGEIDWTWPGEKIRNWIRAQADPYPGAFTWSGTHKIVIDEVKLAGQDSGWSADAPGKVIGIGEQPIVCCSDGCVKLVSIRGSVDLSRGETLGTKSAAG